MDNQQHNHNHNDHSHSHNHNHDHDHGKMIRDFRTRFWISLAITLPIVVMAPLIQDLLGYSFRFEGDRYVQFALSSVLFFYGGWPFLKGLMDELGKRSPGMMTLIALAISVAYIYSSLVVFGVQGKIFFWELATLIDVMLLGHWIEMKSVMGASNALEELAKLLPSRVQRIREDGSTEEIPVEELKKDDTVLVKAGEKIPADGEIIEGKSHVNESMLTGESTPVSKKEGDPVIGGSVNDSGTLKIKVQQTGDDAYLSKVTNMVEEAGKRKSKTQNFADKAAGWLFYIALSAGIITFVTWLFIGSDVETALGRMVTVMVISCPHALGLAIPLVVAISTSFSAQNGLLIRNRTAFEQSRNLDVVIFDKTGTLTKGEFGVTRYKALHESIGEEELLRIAASLEKQSEHPIGAGIVKIAREKELDLEEVSDVETLKGKGITGTIGDRRYTVASPGYMKEQGLNLPDGIEGDEAETIVFVSSGNDLLGTIALADEIREESKSAVRKLKELGLKVYMATGDNKKVAEKVCAALELDKCYSEVLPEDKQKIIKELQDQGKRVAMTGDGINDAPALAQADTGIAVGSGTDLAAETADIILVKSNPEDVTRLIIFGKKTYNKMVQNLFWAAGYNIVAIPLAAGVLAWAGILLNPAMGALLMSLSTVVVAVNAQLLKRSMPKDGKNENS